MNNRRELKSRNTTWASKSSQLLAKMGFTPNSISIISIIFSMLSCLMFYLVSINTISYLLGFILAALFIQLRLICNLMDGMLAIELKMKSTLGDLFNEIPDRFADTFIIIGFSFITNDLLLGLWCSLFAMATAYIRVLGGSLGLEQKFLGPMAKQHRMFLITILCFLVGFSQKNQIVNYGLWVIFIGSMLTFFRRILVLASDLKSKRA